MSRIIEPTAKQMAKWEKWKASRPPAIRALADQFDPWSLYLLKTSNHRVTIISYSDGDPPTVTVAVTDEFNIVAFERQVFGIEAKDLEPCELPSPHEIVGAPSQEQQEENINAMRLERTDLWKRGRDGKAVWIGDGPSPEESVH